MKLILLMTQIMLASLSNKKGAARKRLPVLDGYVAEAPWEPPSEEHCDPEEVTTYFLDATTRITQRFRRQEHRLVDYALVLEAKTTFGVWEEVAKIDCCHAEIHLHQRSYLDNGCDTRVVLRAVSGESDIQESIDSSLDLIYDEYEEYLRKWKNGR